MTMNENNQVKTKTGLPDISETIRLRNPIILIIIAVVIVLFGFVYVYMRVDKKTEKQVEETYSIATEPSADVKKETTVVSTAVAPVTATVSPEVIQQQIALIQEKKKELQQRLSAPLM